MTRKPYDWEAGAALGEHSRRKHKILREYFSAYLNVRCRTPQQSRFRIAVIDGFCGAGRYSDNSPGSPLIFLETLRKITHEINIRRSVENMAIIDFECVLILNDYNREVIEALKENIAPELELCHTANNLTIKPHFMSSPFSEAYTDIKDILSRYRVTRNVFFSLDQYGNSHVPQSILKDILITYQSAEILLTLSTQSLITFLPKDDLEKSQRQLKHHGITLQQLYDAVEGKNGRDQYGAIERLVFESYKASAPFVSPFAINNPDGWRYWLLHLANEPKARQVYNNILHDNAQMQGHYGRAGLRMLTYDPSFDARSYLFTEQDRERAIRELYEDIPNVVSEFGDSVTLGEFHQNISNETPAHSEDIAKAIMENPDLTVLTENGGKRRSHNTLKDSDTLILNTQRSFHLLPRLSSNN
jgi:three-Cys-motif partner protein